jgi:cell division protein FtsB
MIGALLRGSRWQRPLWLVALGVGLAAYFGYHALTGSRGLLAWRDLNAELASTRQELDALRAERTALAEKVARLRHDGLDADLIDELARRQLSLADPLDVIILLDEGP